MKATKSPYDDLPEEAFWSSAVARKNALQIHGLWKPKFVIEKHHLIATAGSCFAQHISRALRQRGYRWADSEPAPADMPANDHADHGYGVFSFRTGNIYTVALLRQWIEWAIGDIDPASLEIWGTDEGRFIDPFRPAIIPSGFESTAALVEARKVTFAAIRKCLSEIDVFVFTLGLTEAWTNTESGAVYPMCPGTVAGRFDADQHQFVNYGYPGIRQALRATIELVKTVNPSICFLLTVSPVPLTATASDQHVLTATSHSKSVLRAVAGDVSKARADTDYFPSYEIISAYPFKGMFYQPNLRNVAPEGVDFVMKSFFECQKDGFDGISGEGAAQDLDQLDEEVCEELILEAFNQSSASSMHQTGKQICFIGNSHLGVIREAWSSKVKAGKLPYDFKFYGAVGNGLSKVYHDGDILKSDDPKVQSNFKNTSGGSYQIQLTNFDAYVFYGVGFPLKAIKTYAAKLEAASAGDSAHFPKEKIEEFLTKSVRGNIVVKLAISIRKTTQAPIFVCQTPMWSILEKHAAGDAYNPVLQYGDRIKRLYMEILQGVLDEHGIQLILQPEETLEGEYFTQEKYIMGYADGRIRDHGHMNSNYGVLALDHVLKSFE